MLNKTNVHPVLNNRQTLHLITNDGRGNENVIITLKSMFPKLTIQREILQLSPKQWLLMLLENHWSFVENVIRKC